MAKREATKIDTLADDPRPANARKLEGEDGLSRVRAGDCRIVFTGPRSPELIDLLTVASEVIAPELCHSEVGNALWKYVRAGVVGVEEAVGLYERAFELLDLVVPDRELAKEAHVAAASLGHPVYDMRYAVLARRQGCTVYTLDKALARTMLAMSIPVICPGQ